MRITVQRSGGFAGLTENIADLETSHLDPETEKKISAKIAGVGFFNYPSVVTGDVGADMYRYEITVTDGAKRHSVAFVESAPEAAGLLDLVQTLKAT
jgi:Emfourin